MTSPSHFLKACPRCTTGDVVQDADIYGPFLSCLQCGYHKDVEPPSRLRPNVKPATPWQLRKK